MNGDKYEITLECSLQDSSCFGSESVDYTEENGELVIDITNRFEALTYHLLQLEDSCVYPLEFDFIRVRIRPKRADILSLAQQDPEVLARLIS